MPAPRRVPEDQRVDMCSAEHDHGGTAAAPAAVAKPYDPTLPIDLSGTPGVTPQQQAAAENLIAVTLVELPQWSDYRVAEAAGFKSIGDAATGHEHFVQWDWIEDDVILDPDFPESLVYEPQPDGSKKLVSAMYMTPRSIALEDVPDIGGALDAVAHPQQPLLLRLARAPAGVGRHEPERRVPDRFRQPATRADDPRVDRAAGVRTVRRARGRRCGSDRGRRRTIVRHCARRTLTHGDPSTR